MPRPSSEADAVAQIMRDAYNQVIIGKYMGKMTAGQMEDEPIGGWKTVADPESEARMVPHLLKLRNIPVVAEETVKVRPETLAGLTKPAYWMVDSLDGTKNYVKAANEFKQASRGFELRNDTSFGIIIGSASDHGLKRGWSLEATYKGGAWNSRVLYAESGGGLWVSERENAGFEPLSAGTDFRRVDGKPVIAIEPDAFNPGILKFSSLSELNAQTGNKFHYTNEYWSSVSIFSGMARRNIAGLVSSDALPWDLSFGLVSTGESGGAIKQLNTGEPFQFGKMKGGFIAGVTPEIVETVRQEALLPISKIRDLEPCIDKHFVANPYWREPATRGFPARPARGSVAAPLHR